MKQRRLTMLLSIAAVLLVARWFMPMRSEPTVVSEAVVRPSRPNPALATSVTPSSEAQIARFERARGMDVFGNAFSIRPPPELPAAPVQPPVILVAQAPFIGPPPPPALPPPAPVPPFSVIGTWDDGKSPGVFLSTPNGTLLARPGGVLLADYRVTALTRNQLSLQQMSTHRDFQFNVPQPANK